MNLPPDDPRHGTKNGYGNLGCRCDRCREAHRITHREWLRRTGRTKRTREEIAAEAATRRAIIEMRSQEHWERVNSHGRGRYQRGCRCKLCVNANRARAREYYREHYSLAAKGRKDAE